MKCTWLDVGIAPCILYSIGKYVVLNFSVPVGHKTNPAFLPEGDDVAFLKDGNHPHQVQVELSRTRELLAKCDDPRFSTVLGHTMMTCNKFEMNGHVRMYFMNLTNRVRELLPLVRRQGHRNWEKNWQIFSSRERIFSIYNLNPLIVLECDLDTGMCDDAAIDDSKSMDFKFQQLRSAHDNMKARLSTPPLPYDDKELIGVGHVKTSNWVYLHFIYTMTKSPPFRVTKYTPLFRLPLSGRIQYVSSMYYINSTHLYLSYGVEDKNYGFAMMSLEDIRHLLHGLEVASCVVNITSGINRACTYAQNDASLCKATCNLNCTKYPYRC